MQLYPVSSAIGDKVQATVEQHHLSTHKPQKINKLSWIGMWSAAFILLLLPLWLFPYIPTQDGPAHLETAAHLLGLSGSPFLESFYTANWHLATNQLYHALLVVLGSFLPLLIAEKLLLSAYALLVPLTTLFAVRGLKGAPFAAFLVLPTVYSYVFYLGFYNLCFGLPLFILALGFYFRLAAGPRRPFLLVALLALTLVLSYFVHIIAAASTLLALGLLSLMRLIIRGDRRTFGLSVMAALPTLALVAFFFAVAPKATEAGTTNFLEFSQLLRSFFVHPPRLVYPLYSSLTFHTWLDVVFTLSLVALLSFFVLFVLVKALRARDLPVPELSVVVLVFFIIVFWIPNRLGEVGWLPDRFLPYAYALLVLWLSSFKLSARGWRTVALIGLGVWGALMLYRLPVHAALSSAVAEYTSAAQVIQDQSTVLPLYLPGVPAPPGLQALRPNLRYDEVRHALGYIALDKRIVDLADYQAAKGYFPLQFTEAKDPMQYLSRGGLRTLEYPPFAFDLAAYRQETGVTVDYVFVWGNIDAAPQRQHVQAILEQLTDYQLIFVSEPQGLMHVYAHQPRTGQTP